MSLDSTDSNKRIQRKDLARNLSTIKIVKLKLAKTFKEKNVVENSAQVHAKSFDGIIRV